VLKAISLNDAEMQLPPTRRMVRGIFSKKDKVTKEKNCGEGLD
jgi:hypothetical protein